LAGRVLNVAKAGKVKVHSVPRVKEIDDDVGSERFEESEESW